MSLRDCCQLALIDGVDPWDHYEVCAGRAEDVAEQDALFGRHGVEPAGRVQAALFVRHALCLDRAAREAQGSTQPRVADRLRTGAAAARVVAVLLTLIGEVETRG